VSSTPPEEPAAASAQAATALAPVAPSAADPTRRGRTPVVVGAVVVGLVAVTAGAVLYLTRGTGAGAANTPTTGTYTAAAPWRLLLRDTFPSADPGCSITLVATDSDTTVPLPTGELYGTIQWQIHQTGAMRWQVSDPNCVVTPMSGVGSLTLPATVQPTIGDSDSFAPGTGRSARVDDFNGETHCVIRLVDAATGALLDGPTVTLGQEPPTVALHPGSAAMAYVNPGDCGVTLSATPS